MSELISEELRNINQLVNKGLYFKALDALDDFEKDPDQPPEDQIFHLIIKSNILSELGRSPDALKFAEEAYKIAKSY